MVSSKKWHTLVLAASRGPDDPMARAYGVSHKCMIEIAGTPMLVRVVETLQSYKKTASVGVAIENMEILSRALGEKADHVHFHQSQSSAPASVLAALELIGDDETVLVTTADHALLDHQMLYFFLSKAEESDADLLVGLASAETILSAYPNAKRTFLKFGSDRVSGCNLFAFKTRRARAVLNFWQRIEKNRKNPIKLISAFGFKALLAYLTGSLDLKKAFELASQRIGLKAEPVLLPFANAAVDVDKPEDKELVEGILRAKP